MYISRRSDQLAQQSKSNSTVKGKKSQSWVITQCSFPLACQSSLQSQASEIILYSNSNFQNVPARKRIELKLKIENTN
jgi:hypothetical protein